MRVFPDGADVHIRGEDGRTPFETAILNKHVEVAQILSEYGAENEYRKVSA